MLPVDFVLLFTPKYLTKFGVSFVIYSFFDSSFIMIFIMIYLSIWIEIYKLNKFPHINISYKELAMEIHKMGIEKPCPYKIFHIVSDNINWYLYSTLSNDQNPSAKRVNK